MSCSRVKILSERVSKKAAGTPYILYEWCRGLVHFVETNRHVVMQLLLQIRLAVDKAIVSMGLYCRLQNAPEEL